MMGFRRRADDGAIAIIVALFSVVFLLIAALVVDLGSAMEQRRDAQKAADLSALAGGQELPDEDAAIQVAAQYLIDNGWGRASDGSDLDVDSLVAQLTNGDDSDGEATATATRLEVTTPSRQIDFVFGPVAAALGGDGFSGTSVDAHAAVEIRSLKDILPFILTSDTEFGENCIKTGSGPRLGPCPDSTEGNFGYALVGRNDSENPVLRANIRFGLDHNPTRYTTEPYVSQGWAGATIQCRTSPSVTPPNAITDHKVSGLYVDGFNCLDSRTGMTIADLTRGLLDYSSPSACDGRIALPTPTCHFSPNLASVYFAGIDWSNVDPDAQIDPSILDDPRFGVVPVVAAESIEDGSSFAYIILDFYGVYLTDPLKRNGTGPLIPMTNPHDGNAAALDAIVFPLSLLPPVGANDSETGDFLGSGPKIPVLVE